MANTLTLHAHTDVATLDKALAMHVAGLLRKALDRRAEATLVVSGGKTPLGFFRELSCQELEWPKVIVTLADERWVDESSPYSNARLIRSSLLQGSASHARFISLYHPASTPDTSAALVSDTLAGLATFDVVVLGMGEDGHTASIFPHSPQRLAALDDTTELACIAIQGGNPVDDRLTLTARRLKRTRNLILHITGERKWNLLGQVVTAATPELPIGFLLDTHCESKNVYWTR